MGSLSVVLCQALDRPASLLFSCRCWHVGRERLWWWFHPLHVTQQYCPAFLASWLSSTDVSHHSLPPHIPSICLRSQQQPSLWDCSTIPKLQLPATVPSQGPASLSAVCMAAARTVWFSFHLGCHRSAGSLSALNVSSLTQTIALLWGLDPLPQIPTQLTAGPVLVTLLFSPLVPSSYWVLHGSIYSFPLGRYSCLLSDGVLHALLTVSDSVFLMYLWREMYSMSTYSSAILFFYSKEFCSETITKPKNEKDILKHCLLWTLW